MSFNIFDHIEKLEPAKKGRYICPVCGGNDLTISKDGAYQCWHGCSCADIRNAIAPLVWEKPNRPQQRREWIYFDGDCLPVIKTIRTDDGEGTRRIWQEYLAEDKNAAKRGVRPYRYQEALKATQKGRFVFWVEGEPTCDALWDLGIASVTTIAGSTNYRSYADYSGLFPSQQVVICPDRDEQGIKYATEVEADYLEAQWCYAFPDSPIWDRLPKDGGADLADWIAEGADSEQIIAAVGEKRSTKTQAATSKEGSSYEGVMAQMDAIFNTIESTAKQKWELGALAKTSGRTLSQILEIYQDREFESFQFAPQDIHDFLAQGSEDREWIIAAHVSAGSTIVLFADGGVGKSLLGYDLIKAVATGSPWNGFKTKQGKCLIIQTDEPEIDTRERLNIANYQEAVKRGMVAIETRWQFSQIRKLRQWIDEQRPLLVMIDSFTSANRSASSEEKDSNYASCLYELRDIANEYGCTFVVLHHSNKAGGARGTTAIRNNVSEVWHLRKGEDKEQLKPTGRILEIEKSRSGCSGVFQIELNVDDYSWKHNGDWGVDEDEPLPLSARLLNYLQLNAGEKFSPLDLAAIVSIGADKEPIRKQLERLRKKGLVEAEERVKEATNPLENASDRKTSIRYKVYFSPKTEESCPANPKPAREEDFGSMDNHSGSKNVSSEPKPAREEDLGFAGQPDSESTEKSQTGNVDPDSSYGF